MPVYSLYSETREPTAEMLAGLDALVIDLQDVGTRIYTYIYTMANCLRAAAPPRPAGHRLRSSESDWRRDGGRPDAPGRFRVVRRTVSNSDAPRHDDRRAGACSSTESSGWAPSSKSCKMHGWSRSQYGDDTGLPWVLPSPNIPTVESAVVYPGTVLLEGTNVSEGRGTTRPFELVGAPWADPEKLSDDLNAPRSARRVLPARPVRTDVPQARRETPAAAARFT